MFLYEIMEEIAERSGHAYSDASIIRKADLLQKRLYRLYIAGTDTTTLDLEEGTSEYPLPFASGNIQDVLVNGKGYDLGRLKGTHLDRYYYLLSGTIGIFPTPDVTVTEGIRLFHRKAPKHLTIGDVEAVPDLDPDYHMLLVYGVLLEILTDSKKKAEYKIAYDELLIDFVLANQDPEIPTIREERWG